VSLIQRLSLWLKNLKDELKGLLLTKAGWVAWIAANVITSLIWFIPFAIGWLLSIPQLITAAGGIWAFIMLPLDFLWVFNILIAIPLRKIIKKII
jgi:hypothetical protein